MRKLLGVVLLAALAFPAGAWAEPKGPKTPYTVSDGPARFQVLSPTLIRLEYAADERFEDGPTLTAVHRGRTRAKVKTKVVHGIRVIATSRMVLRYRIGAGPFDPSNLKLTLGRGKARRTFRPAFTPLARAADSPPPLVTAPNPGDPSPRTQGNLGGWYRGLDSQSGAVPLHDGILTREGWYLLDDSSSPLLIENGRWFASRPAHFGPYQDGYLFGYGHDYATGLRDFRNLTGPAPLLPRQAFGNWFSQYTFYSATDYHKLLARFRAERVPLDVLVIDTDAKAPNPWNGWEWAQAFGPDPAGFLKWAHSKGLAVTLNVHPSIAQNDPAFPAANATAGGLGFDSGRCQLHYGSPQTPCGVWDWARPDHVASYFSVHAPFERDGIDFWWLDWNSDESNANAPGLTPDTWINSLYAQRERDRGSRWLVLSRIGSSFWNYQGAMPGAWAEHRSAIHFTGDAFATWPMLDFEIRFTTAEGAGIGLPYVSHDIGSFQGGELPSDMYVRWVQFGTFQPILRLHSDHGDRLPWEYDKRADRIASGFLRLRDSMVPYIYTAARQAYDSGLPIARPMYLDWPGANQAYRFDGEYMFGDELLAAPVTNPGERAGKRVWFPPGDWVDVFTGTVHHGPGVKGLSVPLGRMPVFARAGSIVPRRTYDGNIGKGPADPLVLDVYAGDDGHYDLYEDSGKGFSYQHGGFARTEFRWHQDGNDATVVIGRARGHYAGMPANRRYILRITGVDRPSRVTQSSGGRTTRLGGWKYDPATRRLELPTGALGSGAGGSVQLDFSAPRRHRHGHGHRGHR
jgi:hypothetical protein